MVFWQMKKICNRLWYKVFLENNIHYKVRDNKFDGKEIFDVTEDEYNLFLNNYIFEYSKNIQIRPFASEIIKKLIKKHKIIIITARDYTTFENKYQTKMQDIVKNGFVIIVFYIMK